MKFSAPPSSGRNIFALLALVAAAFFMSSCRTTEGLGQDIQKLGNKIENEAGKRG